MRIEVVDPEKERIRAGVRVEPVENRLVRDVRAPVQRLLELVAFAERSVRRADHRERGLDLTIGVGKLLQLRIRKDRPAIEHVALVGLKALVETAELRVEADPAV